MNAPVCVKLVDERDAACKRQVELEKHAKGMATKLAKAEARAVRAETELTRQIAQVCC